MNNPYSRNYPSIYRGIVEDNKDPESLGRCKIRVPSVHGELNYPVSILPWARPIVLAPIHKSRGYSNIPDIGDIVWVFFEGTEKDFPVYLGGTYAKGDISVDSDTVVFYEENSTRLSYNRKENIYDIHVGTNHISISSSGITIEGDINIIGDINVTGSIHTTSDIRGAGVSLESHTHGGVFSGGSNTTKPN